MTETGESAAPAGRDTGKALAQAGLAGLVGTVLAPVGSSVVLAALFGGGAAALLALLAVFGVLVAALTVVAGVAPGASRLTGRLSGRVVWAVLVGVAGSVLWLLGWRIGDEAGLGFSGSASVWLVLGVVPFGLVAGALVRRWPVALGSVAALVAVGLGLLRSLALTEPSDVDQALAKAGVTREQLVVTSVPGYSVVPQSNSWVLRRDGKDPYAPTPAIVLHAVDDAALADCDLTSPFSSYPSAASCEIERPGLFFIDGAARTDAYVHRLGDKRMLLVAPDHTDRDLLREAALSIRPTDPPGHFTATIPGYTATSSAFGYTFFEPDNARLAYGADDVRISTRPAEPNVQCDAAAGCEVAAPNLRYERGDREQRYVRTDGGQEIVVSAGMAVDRDVLRTATLDARPPADDELRLMLRPAPTAPVRSVMGAIRALARALFDGR
ncbi:hypothetical protein ACOBQX_02760 [Actinokineospora sp. G85]|uniref:hypothetical protein n=1 Tax=Actinokineospora sp. G85 TaxID=3406626 RepID=UPI003C795F9C